MPRLTAKIHLAEWIGMFIFMLGLNSCGNDNHPPSGSTPPPPSPPLQADLALGQINFSQKAANFVDGGGVFSPGGIAVDQSANRLYVADTQNNRILGYDITGLATGDPADIVIGQADFNSSSCNSAGSPAANTLCGPAGVAVDGSGNLYVADTGNNRVLVYTGGISSGMNASIVLGQIDFSTNANSGGGVTATSLSAPSGVAVDSGGNVYVADAGNNRVLEYNTLAGSGNTVADHVFGQLSDLTFSQCNNGGITAGSLCTPMGVAVDTAGNLYVSDSGNNRVLEFNTPLSDNTADHVFGQAGVFTTNGCNTIAGGLSANSLCFPKGIAVTGTGNLYVADTNNNRVLEYNSPLTTDTTADLVFGQNGNFANPGFFPANPANACNNTNVTVGVGGLNANSLCLPQGVALDSGGNLYVADTNNNRILQYLNPLATDTTADLVLGQGTGGLAFARNGNNFVDAVGFDTPKGMAVDRSVSPNRLYVADSRNNRVLGYSDISLLATGAAADIVIGQLDLNSNLCNQGATASASTLCNPRGLAVDTAGNLYVADTDNNRVLEYNTPFTSDKTADHVYGQGDVLTTSICNNTAPAVGGLNAKALCGPQAVALDTGNNLYVADTNNNRALEYNSPLTDTTADLVFGQGFGISASGIATGGAATSLTDSAATFTSATNNFLLVITGGTGSGQSRIITSNTGATQLNVDTAWTVVPDNTSTYQILAGFTTNVCNNTAGAVGGLGANSLCLPAGLALDAGDNLYVADSDNHRVLEFNSPLATDTAADIVIGQTDFDQQTPGISDESLYSPQAVALDSNGNLFVADTNNSRVLEFIDPLAGDAVADEVIGQSSLDNGSCNSISTGGVSNASLCFPQGISLDSGDNLYVADTNNNRVLRFVP